ncbi:MAG: hypothetical protein WAQ27_00805 [Candidatus Microsaccharimonas sp.]
MNKKIKIALLIGVPVLIIVAIAYIPVSTYLKLQAASPLDRIGLQASSYKETRAHCPTNIELEFACLRTYYAAEDDQALEENLTKALVSSGFSYKKFPNGYDGGSQIAYSAYDQENNLSYIFIIMKTTNEEYKKSMGNFRTETYIGKK